MTQPHLCLVNSLRTWGGAEVWFLETALALKKRGHCVSVVAQPDSQLLKRCLKQGLAVQPLAIRFDAAPWTLAKLTNYFRRTKVTAVLANLTKDLKAASLAGRMAGVETILGSRESDFPLKDKSYYRWYFNHLASGMLVNSEATRNTVMQSAPWLQANRVHLLYKGIDLNKFSPADNLPENVVGFAGQFIPRKGLLSLMKAWSLLDRKYSNMSEGKPILHLVGDGPMRSQLKNWRHSLISPKQVIINQHSEDMPAFYREISLLVMPSLSEGFGLVAAEAMACGVPVIASRISSLPEIVTHEKTGLLVPPDDAETLAAAMCQLLKNHSQRRQMGLAGTQFVEHNFDICKTLDHLETLTGLKGSE